MGFWAGTQEETVFAVDVAVCSSEITLEVPERRWDVLQFIRARTALNGYKQALTALSLFLWRFLGISIFLYPLLYSIYSIYRLGTTGSP